MEAQIFSQRLPDIQNVMPLNSGDSVVMQELYEVLKKHNSLQRFGITLLHEHFEIEEDEVLIEMTNRKTRTQTIFPVNKNHPDLCEAIETSWRLDTGMPVMSCKCLTKDGSHEHYHIR